MESCFGIHTFNESPGGDLQLERSFVNKKVQFSNFV